MTTPTTLGHAPSPSAPPAAAAPATPAPAAPPPPEAPIEDSPLAPSPTPPLAPPSPAPAAPASAPPAGRSHRLVRLAVLGSKHLAADFAEWQYLHHLGDRTRPVSVYGLVTTACNARCRQCTYWRYEPDAHEMSIDQWQHALAGLRNFIGAFSVNFSGGEPFVKPGFLSLMEFCRDRGIQAGVTTNGTALSPAMVRRLVAARPFNVNVSVDAPVADLNDYLRGVPGLLARIERGLGLLREAATAAGVSFPIIIKPTINALNLAQMPHMAAWARRHGATAVSYQAVDRATPEVDNELWIGPAQQTQLAAVVEELIAQRRAGEPILNSDDSLRTMIRQFAGETSAPAGPRPPCRVGLRNFMIYPTGDVAMCHIFGAAGNLTRLSARDLWYSQRARTMRRATTTCQRPCAQTCYTRKTLRDKLRAARVLFLKK